MAINNVSLLASAAYNKVMNNNQVKDPSPIKDAVNFHKMVDGSFNQLSKLSPAEILSRVNNVRSVGNVGSSEVVESTSSPSAVLQATLHSLNEDLKKHDKLSRKAAVGDVSLVEMLESISELRNKIQVLLVVRDKFLEAFDKLMNMQV